MSASLASPSKTGWRMLASPAHFRKGHFGEHSNSLNLLASGHCIAYHLIKIAYLLWLYFVLCLSLILSFSYLVNLSVTISPFYLSYTLFLHILSFSLFPISILSYALLISTDCFSTNIFNKFIHQCELFFLIMKLYFRLIFRTRPFPDPRSTSSRPLFRQSTLSGSRPTSGLTPKARPSPSPCFTTGKSSQVI